MTSVQRLILSSQDAALQTGRSTHGRWRVAYRRAAQPAAPDQAKAALVIIYDPERLVFTLAEGPAAVRLAEHLTTRLWQHADPLTGWPAPLTDWLAAVPGDDPPPAPTGLICGRLERHLPGGLLTCAWLGMHTLRLLDHENQPIPINTQTSDQPGWMPGDDAPPLRYHYGPLHECSRLLVYSSGLDALGSDLADLSNTDLELALDDYAAEAAHDLACFDLRLNPVGTPPARAILHYRWTAPEICVLSWAAPTGATAFRLEESETTDFARAAILAELSDTRQTQYRFTPAAHGIRYYRLTPLSNGTAGPPSDPVRVTPVPLTAPILEPIAWSGEGGFILSWTLIPAATSYEVQASPSSAFEAGDARIIYRGASPRMHLPADTAPSQFYRVRALNVVYAPQTPSPWSIPQRAPDRLSTPRLTSVTDRQIVWDPVDGAGQYAVRVTARGTETTEGELIYTAECVIPVADRSASYRVRAMRHTGDLRTASEWSEPVTVVPPMDTSLLSGSAFSLTVPVLIGLALAALVVGAGLALAGWSVYRDITATETPTLLPAALVDATRTQAARGVQNETAVLALGGALDTLASTATAQAGDHATLQADHAAARETLQARLAFDQTQTHIPTRTPSLTPDRTATFAGAFGQALTATAVAATHTATPSVTPDLTQTVAAALQDALAATETARPPATATATLTPTRRPSATPDHAATHDAALLDALPDDVCLLVANELPVYDAPQPDSAPILTTGQTLVTVVSRLERRDAATDSAREAWLGVQVLRGAFPVRAWMPIPEAYADQPAALYRGGGCPPPLIIEIMR